MLRQQGQRQFPDDAAFQVGERVKLVHHDRGNIGKVEPVRVQQAIEQNLGDDDEDAASGFILRLPVIRPMSSREKPQRSAASCISWNFCSVSAISGVV